MKTGIILHLIGCGLTLLLLRLGGGPEDVITQLAVCGGLLVLIGLSLSFKRDPDAEGAQSARLWRISCQLLGVLGLALVAAITLEWLGDGSVGQTGAVLQVCAALLIWLSIVPLWTVERVRSASPVMLPASRVRAAGFGGLSVALAIAVLFPVNYLASANNVRWDHSYFKTAEPGDVTRSTIANLDEPIQAWLFFPSTSDVTEEV